MVRGRQGEREDRVCMKGSHDGWMPDDLTDNHAADTVREATAWP